MHEFELIKKYFSKLSKKSKGSLNLNDDVFFDKSRNIVVSVDTYNKGKHFLNFKNPELVIKKVIRALRSSRDTLFCINGCFRAIRTVFAKNEHKNVTS